MNVRGPRYVWLNVKEFNRLNELGYPSFNLIENLNRRPKAYYVIRARIAGRSIKEMKELPNCECDRRIKCLVTTSNHYYVTHKNKERIITTGITIKLFIPRIP